MYAGFTRHACPSTIYAAATICCRISNQRFASQTNTVYTCMTPEQITTPINPHLSGKSTVNNANCRKPTISGWNLQPSASRYASKSVTQTDFVNGRCSRRSSNSPNHTNDIESVTTIYCSSNPTKMGSTGGRIFIRYARSIYGQYWMMHVPFR